MAIGLMLYYAQRSRVRDAYMKAMTSSQLMQNGPGVDGPVTITLSDEGVEWLGAGDSSRAEWPAFEDILWDDQTGLAITLSQRMYIVPVRAFDDLASFHVFMNQLRDRNESAGGVPVAIQRYLQYKHFRCVGCGYEVGGVAEARCPECGRAIELSDFRRTR